MTKHNADIFVKNLLESDGIFGEVLSKHSFGSPELVNSFLEHLSTLGQEKNQVFRDLINIIVMPEKHPSEYSIKAINLINVLCIRGYSEFFDSHISDLELYFNKEENIARWINSLDNDFGEEEEIHYYQWRYGLALISILVQLKSKNIFENVNQIMRNAKCDRFVVMIKKMSERFQFQLRD